MRNYESEQTEENIHCAAFTLWIFDKHLTLSGYSAGQVAIWMKRRQMRPQTWKPNCELTTDSQREDVDNRAA